MSKIQRALLSVHDKRDIVDLAKVLHQQYGVEILSTGGTAEIIRNVGVPVIEVSDYTGFPEMMEGRVKTLHPRIHGGLLYLRGKQSHREEALDHDIKPIDLVVVNLYPFEKTIARIGCTFDAAIEQIDIGGPAMLRSAAKNYQSVTSVVDPEDYHLLLDDMKANDGAISQKFRLKCMHRVFEYTADYDGAIARYLEGVEEL